jgi:hypothetical protein
MIIMKYRGKIIGLIVLLVAGLMVTPALGSMQKAGQRIITSQYTKIGTVTLDFVDCTGAVPIKKEITIPRAEWNEIRNELQAISSDSTMSETLQSQLTILQKHNLVPSDVTIDTFVGKINQRANTPRINSLASRIHAAPIINNSIFNAMCAINFVLTNGTTGVFGLNTFVNLIGFDIVSFHKGYAPNGIQSNGLISRSSPAGTYVGAMFGFLGYWLGEKVSAGIYSNLTAAGFTIFTVWLPIPLNP